MSIRIKDITDILERYFPAYLAEKWDNVGLQIGDSHQLADNILITLDVDQDVVKYAIKNQVQLIICHHPLIFQPLSSLDFRQPTSKLIKSLIEAGICVYAAHTNLDKGERGISQVLAEKIGLENIRPLDQGYQDILYKLVVYVPKSHEMKVQEAIMAAGAGCIGRYSDCSFKVRGIGSFKPSLGTDPYIGQAGVLSEVEECRLETVVPREKLSRVVNQLIRSHPYEEPAYDIFRLENQGPVYSLGRVGNLPESITVMELGAVIKNCLGVDSLRVAGDLNRMVSKIAVVSGAGASFLTRAHQVGCDVLVTGDLKYHEAREAADIDLSIIDAGHQGTEQIICSYLPDLISAELINRGWQARILSFLNQPYIKNL